jgi:hypothetical protein
MMSGDIVTKMKNIRVGTRPLPADGFHEWKKVLGSKIPYSIKAHARISLPLHRLAETGQDKLAVLFYLFVGERAERIDQYSSGSFVGLRGFGKCICSLFLKDKDRFPPNICVLQPDTTYSFSTDQS